MPTQISGTGIQTPGLASDSMPTSGGDAVVESGSNSDGEWTRWADGTQAANANVVVDLSVQNNAIKFPTPISFENSYNMGIGWGVSGAPGADGQNANGNALGGAFVGFEPVLSDWTFFNGATANADLRTIFLFAYGRWK